MKITAANFKKFVLIASTIIAVGIPAGALAELLWSILWWLGAIIVFGTMVLTYMVIIKHHLVMVLVILAGMATGVVQVFVLLSPISTWLSILAVVVVIAGGLLFTMWVGFPKTKP